MTDKLPDPLVPADVDLRGYEFMPLYGDRLLKSETWISGTAEAKVAALRLWWHAFAHETPAGSLPNDDRFLAEYAGYGEQVRAWQKIRPQAMRNWKACSDGRLYHPVVAEIVVDCWNKRLSASAKGKNGASKRWGKHRHEKPIAQASGNNGTGNAPATGFDAKESKGKDKGVNNNASTRGGSSQNLLKKFPETPETDSSKVERNRKIAEALSRDDTATAERLRAEAK